MRDDDLAQAIEADYRTAAIDDRRRAMLAFALKLTRTPAAMAPDDVRALRAVGFADPDVLAIAEVTSYYAYANRIASGLGVALEP